MTVRTQTPPAAINSLPRVNVFNRDDFHNALWENGYEVMLEEAIACPCKGTSVDSKSTCSNCLGSGWVFINPITTRAFITSINRSTKYKDWSPEFIGTVAVTLMDVDRVGFMDKITLTKNFSALSEVLPVRQSSNPTYGVFAFATYRFSSIRSVFVYDDDSSPLIKLATTDYVVNSTNDHVLDIKSSALPVNFNGKVSVSYRHKVTYNVLDIPHDMRITKYYDNNGTRETQDMPVQAIARKSQYELGKATNYANNNIQNNSYL